MTFPNKNSLIVLLYLIVYSNVSNANLTQEFCNVSVPRATQTTPAIINNGLIMLGIFGEGNLNVNGGVPDGHDGTTVVGLRYFRDGA